jgi:hypothetical protein
VKRPWGMPTSQSNPVLATLPEAGLSLPICSADETDYFRVVATIRPEPQDRPDSNLETRFGLLSTSDVQSLTFVYRVIIIYCYATYQSETV